MFTNSSLVTTIDVVENVAENNSDIIMPETNETESAKTAPEKPKKKEQTKIVDPSSLKNSFNVKATVPGYTICTECGQFYCSNRASSHLMQHLKANFSKFHCQYCTAVFGTLSELNSHGKIKHPDLLPCSHCGRKFDDYTKLHYHIRKTHIRKAKRALAQSSQSSSNVPNDIKKNFYNCPDCKQSLPSPSDLKQHLKTSHTNWVDCLHCDRSFAHPWIMDKHRRIAHRKKKSSANKVKSKEVKRARCNGKCPLCGTSFGFNVELLNHLKTDHQIVISLEEHTFKSLSEFNRWKFEMERTTKAYFVRETTTRNPDTTIDHFLCNRSGFLVSKADLKRAVKRTKKINATCPARIVTTMEGNEVKVRFFGTHVGHECDIRHLPLSNQDQRKVEDFLRSGLSVGETFKACRALKQTESLRVDTVERLNVIDKHAVRYIANKLKQSSSKVVIKPGRPPSKNPNAKKRIRKPRPKPTKDKSQINDDNIQDKSDTATKTVSASCEIDAAISSLIAMNSDDNRNQQQPPTSTTIDESCLSLSPGNCDDGPIDLDFSDIDSPMIPINSITTQPQFPPSISSINNMADHDYFHHQSNPNNQNSSTEHDPILDYILNYWNNSDLNKRLMIARTLQPKIDELNSILGQNYK